MLKTGNDLKVFCGTSNKQLALDICKIMNIKLGHLERGQYRELFPDEVESLKKMLEGSTNLPKSEQMKLDAEKKATERRTSARPTTNRKPATGKKPATNTRPAAEKKPIEKKTAERKPTAFQAGNKVYRTVPKFYPRPEEEKTDK